MRPAIEAVIKNCKENVIGAEVGVYEGGHAKALLQHPNIKKLYLIDICEFKSLRKNIAPFLNKINLMIPMSSEDASKKIADKSLDFVYVDADHTYDNCKKDLNLWWGKVKDGGILCGHDYSNTLYTFAKQAVDEVFPNGVNRMLENAIYNKDTEPTVFFWWKYV